MSVCRFSRAARKDLDQAWDFVAEDSIERADRFIDLLIEKCELIAEHPGIGRACDELATGLRFVPVRSFVVFYRRTNAGVEIARILSGYRDIEDLLDDSVR